MPTPRFALRSVQFSGKTLCCWPGYCAISEIFRVCWQALGTKFEESSQKMVKNIWHTEKLSRAELYVAMGLGIKTRQDGVFSRDEIRKWKPEQWSKKFRIGVQGLTILGQAFGKNHDETMGAIPDVTPRSTTFETSDVTFCLAALISYSGPGWRGGTGGVTVGVRKAATASGTETPTFGRNYSSAPNCAISFPATPSGKRKRDEPRHDTCGLTPGTMGGQPRSRCCPFCRRRKADASRETVK